MKEKNKDTLDKALGSLPSYDPPAENWNRVGEQLGLGRLPSYAPPVTAWNSIDASLEQNKGGRVVKLRWVYAAAAALVLLLAATFVFDLGNGAPKVNYAYHQETATAPVVADWDEEEESFARVLRQIGERNEPMLNKLSYELNELTSAREEVKAMLVSYGKDATMVRQLAEIERERSDVYRRIIVAL